MSEFGTKEDWNNLLHILMEALSRASVHLDINYYSLAPPFNVTYLTQWLRITTPSHNLRLKFQLVTCRQTSLSLLSFFWQPHADLFKTLFHIYIRALAALEIYSLINLSSYSVPP
jgi:hypothetical protein